MEDILVSLNWKFSQLEKNKNLKRNQGYLIHAASDNAFKCTVVNQTCHLYRWKVTINLVYSLLKCSLKYARYVTVRKFSFSEHHAIVENNRQFVDKLIYQSLQMHFLKEIIYKNYPIYLKSV